MAIWYSVTKNRWYARVRGKTKVFLKKEDAVSWEYLLKEASRNTGHKGPRLQALASGNTRYIGRACGVCGCVVKATANRKCITCLATRQRRVSIARPKWANLQEIKSIYEHAHYNGLEVDHIVPLVSKIVCGLHCPANLAAVPISYNRAKGNKYWPDMP